MQADTVSLRNYAQHNSTNADFSQIHADQNQAGRMKKCRISLKQFIITGNFGPITLGMNGNQLIEALGEPDEVGQYLTIGGFHNITPLNDGNSDLFQARVWSYGDFEFHFSGPNATDLFLIYTDGFKKLSGGSKLRLLPWIFKRYTKKRKVERKLKKLGISCQDYHANGITDYEIDRIITENGIEFGFIKEEFGRTYSEKPGLCYISYSSLNKQ